MSLALEQARIAAIHDEVPIGAVIVDENGDVIARAYNQVEKKRTQTAHAEMLALAEAGKKRGWRLEGCVMYVTLEPCAMCMHALYLSRVSELIYGASSPLFGFRLDKHVDYSIYKVLMKIRSGVCAEQAAALLKVFFKSKRRDGDEYHERGTDG